MAELEASHRAALDVSTATDAAADVAWTPPTDLGPMPAELRERAAALVAEQRESLHTLNELQRETGRHLAAVRAVPSTRQDQSVYLDVSG
jgi:hypothetical protein